MLAVSVDPAEDGRALASSKSLTFPLLVADAEMARAWGLADDDQDIFRPTTLVVDRAGIVRYVYLGRRSNDRPDLTDVLAALDALGG